MNSTTDPAALLVVDPDDEFVQELAENLQEEVHHARSASAAARAVEAGRIGVLVVGPNIEFEEGIQVIDDARDAGIALGAVFITRRPSTTQLRRAMQSGVADVLSLGHEADELLEAVSRAWADAGTTAAPAVAAEEPLGGELGRVVTVFSPKGGAGKSTVSANLAVLLAGQGSRVVLLDLDLQFGDAAIMFQATPSLTIADAVASLDDLDAETIEDYVVSHSSGVDIFAAPAQPSQADHVTPDHVGDLLGLLIEVYDYVVVDTPAMFTDVVLAAIDVSDQLVLLGGFDVPSIKNLRLALSTLNRLGVDQDDIQVVMTRSNAKVGLRLPEVERTLGATIDVGIPSNRSVPISLNHGVPLAIEQPRSPVVEAIAEIASKVTGTKIRLADAAEPEGGRMRRLMNRSRSTANTTPSTDTV